VPPVDAGERGVMGATQEGKGNVAVYRSGHTIGLGEYSNWPLARSPPILRNA
jgi:hypothetical protein